jgi:DNA-nicking Smr family endonuclease
LRHLLAGTPKVYGKKLRIITGTGHHSIGGKARIKPQVIKYLDDNRHPWEQVTDAIIDVTPRPGALADL